MEGTANLSQAFLRWWYIDLCRDVFAFAKRLYVYVTDLFSIPICLKTLFSPWKRDQLSTEGLSLKDRFQILVLNLSSRFIGFVIKTFTIATYLITVVAMTLFIIGAIIIWFLYPMLLFCLIVWGIRMLVLGS